jgi:hypothetical protein
MVTEPSRCASFSTDVSMPRAHVGPNEPIVSSLASERRTPMPRSFDMAAASASRRAGSFQISANCPAMNWRARSYGQPPEWNCREKSRTTIVVVAMVMQNQRKMRR